MSFINNIASNRMMNSSNNYKFGKIKDLKRYVINTNPTKTIIDLGIGEPDKAASPIVGEVLKTECLKKENRKYADNGSIDYCIAASEYLKNLYNVDNIDPYTEILHGIGSKSILAYLSLCFIDKGDYIINTVPGYPVLSSYTRYLDGQVYNLPLLKENDFLPNLNKIPNEVSQKAKIFYINYPNNPTGAVANKDFYEEIVSFGLKNNILIVSDLAYGPLVYENSPLSILSINNAKQTSVEVHSMSKAFNMTGWRMAFIAGNKEAIKLYAKVKQNSDSGQFLPIQKASIEALKNPSIIYDNLKRYKRRMINLVNILKDIGFDIEMPKGTFYCYTKIPKGTKNNILFKNAHQASEYILKKALISTVPWDNAGGYLRFSVTFEADSLIEEEKIFFQIKKRLEDLELIF
ncbi:aminotransferase class I/II-fold pyridoxal phosphate-dependent enzyme [Clostridium sp. D2Q-11]|uniref:Aminotransferase n=1 Tax=Anaeromonas frigoriresistens TaxID=2683708 RepID=A0A942UXE0_9FIRM|nr:aminotransferase class I/II-fold pyridoxal phosphate-dependent enzyme [Anaeromonas frigoriresistens]MBS4538706.1 aminotransferase class I/II-fold pyridoxal phosphate-dependent enzyme [Anaeromonas frigoriresistens]